MQSTLDLLINKYGITLSLEQLGEVLKNTPKTLDNKIRLGTMPIPTFREGGRRLAFAKDVAIYLDRRYVDTRRRESSAARSAVFGWV
jgi:hypothetical protein